jgi:hypothetical protein
MKNNARYSADLQGIAIDLLMSNLMGVTIMIHSYLSMNGELRYGHTIHIQDADMALLTSLRAACEEAIGNLSKT